MLIKAADGIHFSSSSLAMFIVMLRLTEKGVTLKPSLSDSCLIQLFDRSQRRDFHSKRGLTCKELEAETNISADALVTISCIC